MSERMMTRQGLEQMVYDIGRHGGRPGIGKDAARRIADAIWAKTVATQAGHTDGASDMQFGNRCVGEAVRVLVLSDESEHLNRRAARLLREVANSETFSVDDARGMAVELDRAVQEEKIEASAAAVELVRLARMLDDFEFPPEKKPAAAWNEIRDAIDRILERASDE